MTHRSSLSARPACSGSIRRRTFLSGAVMLSAALLTGCSSSDEPAPPEPAAAPQLHRYLSGPEGFDTASYWIDTGAEVVVFDAQFTPQLAEQMLAQIRAQSDSPVRYVVVTHPNPDKFNGASVFQSAGAQLVASTATTAAMAGVHAYKEAYFVGVGMFEAGSYPALPSVDITFDESLELELQGGVSVNLQVLDNPGVATTQTVALLGDAVITGDLTANGVHAWLEGGISNGAPTPAIDGWIAALEELRALAGDEATIYPGRGEPGQVGSEVTAQQAYLAGMRTLVRDYLVDLAEPMTALSGEEAASHYEAIAAAAREAYPERGLDYLIQFGVYGLALQQAALLSP